VGNFARLALQLLLQSTVPEKYHACVTSPASKEQYLQTPSLLVLWHFRIVLAVLYLLGI